jgi:hypothetical protein
MSLTSFLTQGKKSNYLDINEIRIEIRIIVLRLITSLFIIFGESYFKMCNPKSIIQLSLNSIIFTFQSVMP